eukprot:GHRR01015696.1.p1 GENE.GHRR01015696.1~~GHRR01015696.1.p1  ORF type:complete len:121 (-),score=10.22 GHRR01015696.1:226-588(-)
MHNHSLPAGCAIALNTQRVILHTCFTTERESAALLLPCELLAYTAANKTCVTILMYKALPHSMMLTAVQRTMFVTQHIHRIIRLPSPLKQAMMGYCILLSPPSLLVQRDSAVPLQGANMP